jgi:hypothetical protein
MSARQNGVCGLQTVKIARIGCPHGVFLRLLKYIFDFIGPIFSPHFYICLEGSGSLTKDARTNL